MLEPSGQNELASGTCGLIASHRDLFHSLDLKENRRRAKINRLFTGNRVPGDASPIKAKIIGSR